MDIAVSHEQGRVPVTVFHIKGDLVEEEVLKTRAQEMFENGTRHLLLDLRGVPFISSGGLRALHATYMLLRTESSQQVSSGLRDGTYKSGHLKLLKPSERAMKVLQMAGFDMFLEVHSNLKQAVASF
ncbi:MAG: hypothetical protein Kow0063_17850 [Anaerolineae bacterium]